MIYDGLIVAHALGTRLGGVPLAPTGFAWPVCRSCSGYMQFLAQVEPSDIPGAVSDTPLLIFMCQNRPGLCDEWEPRSGGNQAVVVPPGPVAPVSVPDAGNAVQLSATREN
jgi:hypothetical protein